MMVILGILALHEDVKGVSIAKHESWQGTYSAHEVG